ncbi:MAG: hypothetical protein ACRCYU_23865 [Nocardioides sp.]
MAEHRHKRDARARRLPPTSFIAGPLAVVATASVVSVGVLMAKVPSADDQAPPAPLAASIASSLPERAGAAVSRSFDRASATSSADQSGLLLSARYRKKLLAGVREIETSRAVRRAEKKLWASEDLNLWSAPGRKATKVGTVESGDKLLITGRSEGDRAEVVVDGKAYWVTAEYLTSEEPIPGIGGSCENGSTVPGGVSGNIVKVHAGVCAAFPEITRYGTLRGGGGDHPLGRAVDISVSGSRGAQVAEFVRANAAALGVSYVIYQQRIWSVERGGEGWRGMPDRGSATANHFDHVHVSTF